MNNIQKSTAIKCPQCGKMISSAYESCPYCDYQLPVENNLCTNESNKFIEKLKNIKSRTLIIIIVLILSFSGLYCDDLTKQIENLNNQIETLNYEYERIKVDNNKLHSNWNELTSRNNYLEKEINNYKDQQATIDELNLSITELHNQYDSLLVERDELQSRLDYEKAEEERIAREEAAKQYEDDDYGTVYWTPNGEVYHITPNCVALKRSSSVFSGTIDQGGKSRSCKLCN